MGVQILSGRFQDGSAAIPAKTYILNPTLGQYRIGSNNEGFSAGGTLRWDYDSTRLKLATTYQLQAGSNVLIGSVADKLNASHLAIASQAIGDLLYADATTTFARLAAVAVGQVLVSGGVGTAPAWSASPTLTSVLVGDGAAGTPSFAFASTPALGLYKISATKLGVATGVMSFGFNGTGVTQIDGASGFIQMGSTTLINWTSGTEVNAVDLTLARDAANTLAQRNGTNAQAFKVYGTYTDPSNYERVQIFASSGSVGIIQQAAGTGATRALEFGVANAAQWRISTTGMWQAVTDNSFDIGASGANRPKDYYGAGKITSAGATSGVGYATGAGGAVTQATSRTTGVTLNTVTGDITLFSAAGSATPFTFTVTDSAVAITDNIVLNQKSGTDLYHMFVTNVAAGSFKVTLFTTGGTTTEQPVFHFSVLKGVSS